MYSETTKAGIEQALVEAVAEVIKDKSPNPIRKIGEILMKRVAALPATEPEPAINAAPEPAIKAGPARRRLSRASSSVNEADVPAGADRWSAAQWLVSKDIDVTKAIAPVLVDAAGGSLSIDELSRVRSFGSTITVEALESALLKGGVARALADAMVKPLRMLSESEWASAHELVKNPKYADSTTAGFADTSAYFGGLERIMGGPNPRLRRGMEIDHNECDDSHAEFTAPNYGVRSTSAIEYAFVAAPSSPPAPLLAALKDEEGRPAPREDWPRETAAHEAAPAFKPRVPMQLPALGRARLAINQRLAAVGGNPLLEEECLGLRLYTGALFVKYNGVLRSCLRIDGKPVPFFVNSAEQLCQGNQYATTIYVISSGILKLSKVESAGKVYRGLSGLKLPDEMMRPNADGVRGGVECSFISTTRERSVAKAYAAGDSAGIVLEINMGIVDRGADLSWLSQYSFEREVVFPPLCALEVASTDVDRGGLVVCLGVKVNPAHAQIEQVVAKMKNSHLQLLELLGDDLLQAGAPKALLTPLSSLRAQQAQHEPTWFTVPEHYMEATRRAFEERRMIFRDATSRGSEKLWTGLKLPPEALAKRMREVATLASVEGEDLAALALLGLSLNFAPLDEAGAVAVQTALAKWYANDKAGSPRALSEPSTPSETRKVRPRLASFCAGRAVLLLPSSATHHLSAPARRCAGTSCSWRSSRCRCGSPPPGRASSHGPRSTPRPSRRWSRPLCTTRASRRARRVT